MFYSMSWSLGNERSQKAHIYSIVRTNLHYLHNSFVQEFFFYGYYASFEMRKYK